MPSELYSEILKQIGIPLWLFIISSIWALVWKGFALWKSARLKQPVWFIALLIVNTFGIFEILYIFLFSKISLNKEPIRRKKKR